MDGSALLSVSLGAVFLALGALLYAFVAPESAERQAVNRSLALVAAANGRQEPVRPEGTSFVDRVLIPSLHRLAGLAERLSSHGYADWLRRAIDRAGNPPRWTVQRVLGAKTAGLLSFGTIGLLWGVRFGIGGAVVAPLVGAAAGFYLPDLLLYNAGLKRTDQIRRSLAEAIDMLTVCVEAGLAFDAALAQVARSNDGPLAREMQRVLQSLQVGTSRGEALTSMAERTKVPELQAFVSAIVQADGLGIPVADVLREQSREMRTKRRQRAEEKAQQIPVKILFPMIMFIFPSLFVVVIGPGAIQAYQAFAHR